MTTRPWKLSPGSYDAIQRLAPMWLRERGGCAVYQNQNFDSSSMGDLSVIPLRYIGEGNEMVDAPEDFLNTKGLASTIQTRVDTITLDEFGGDVEACIETCFAAETEEFDG